MQKITFLVCLLFIAGRITAQSINLVTNPGFERYNNCPTDRGQINSSLAYDSFATVIDWVDPMNTSPDYFNRCSTDSTVKLPYTTFDGYHEPHGGDACAGISIFSGLPDKDTADYWSEYLETQLASPMLAGHTYYINFYVCLTYHSRATYNIISVDRIGARLTTAMTDTTCVAPMFYMSGAFNISTPPGVFITDTTNWTLISGTYVATGGEQWLTIGRFYAEPIKYELLRKADISPDFTINSNTVCYMLVDDVCVIDMETPIGTDTTIYTPQVPVTIGPGRPAGQYMWYNGDTSLQTQITQYGTYLRERWTDCTYYIDTFKVAEMPVENCLWLPTAFTPNGDGLDDLFGPGNSFCQPDFSDFSFTIYNRWGQVVFHSQDAGEKWDGSYNGSRAETGSYYYVLRYSYGNSFYSLNKMQATSPKIIRGDVTLIR